MQSCPLPVELCEAIMDSCKLDDSSPHTGCRTEGQTQDTLCACALTCRAWLRTNPLLTTPFSVAEFLAALHKDPEAYSPVMTTLSLGSYARRLELARATELFAYRFPALAALELHFALVCFPPRILRMRLPLLNAITAIELSWCEFDSLRGLFDFIWTPQYLSWLRIIKPLFTQRVIYTADVGTRLSAAAKHMHGCKRLSTLSLDLRRSRFAQVPLTPFGFTLNSLQIAFEGDAHAREYFGGFDSLFPALTSLGVDFGKDVMEAGGSPHDEAVARSLESRLEPTSFLRVLVNALAAPGRLRFLYFKSWIEAHVPTDPADRTGRRRLTSGSALGNMLSRGECCEGFERGGISPRGVVADPGSDSMKLCEVLSGLEEFRIDLGRGACANRCARHLVSGLPCLRNVIRF
ncbi:hypothetical protein C8Q77DRAFT_582 [Trametes polyzona]|nr:hypothetical protein C8Q77DRAFT_582 [Trametes polyzona]